MRHTSPTVHYGRPREAKRITVHRISSIEDKLKRHRRKARIWRRAVKRLATEVMLATEPALAQ